MNMTEPLNEKKENVGLSDSNAGLAADIRDAARYRWLRNHGSGFCELSISPEEYGMELRGTRWQQIPECLDAAIDAAIAKAANVS
jgi:hypothetical protein